MNLPDRQYQPTGLPLSVYGDPLKCQVKGSFMSWRGGADGRSRLSGRGQAGLVATFALAAGCLALAGSGTAAAAPLPACAAGSAPDTVVRAYTGAAQYWTVPTGVTQATFTVYGANGGTQTELDAAGGSGAEVTGTLPVSAGDVFQVNVGQAGAYDGDRGTPVGFGGGGQGGSDGGGGGGASDVRDGAYGLTDRLLVAGGGGGGGENGTSQGLSSNGASPQPDEPCGVALRG
jgi:hypothetical protein